LWLSVAKPNVYREISFSSPHPQPFSSFLINGRREVWPRGYIQNSHAIASAISSMPDDPLSLWERARVRGAGWHNADFAHFVKIG
jgi:hypothetical protein